ncbi:XRCC4-like factor-domain-containing protein [Lipomyces chichibuensis]|uniref:XRCC4-like factor-domain-containing protein n=1 Tax=Lipomyces chichibuensis TaxID=1546026 RepID=UPI003344036B
MENPGKIRWGPLRVSPRDQPPTILLAHFTCTTDSYSFTVTDLQSFWVDSASRDDIIDRALQDRCIVDVSQSANLNVLLARLSDSLTGNELPEGTKLEAMRFEENLRITISWEMSASSMPLVWIFRLQSAPSTNFVRDIFLGSLGIIDALQSQISALQAIALEKDYHISALQEVLQECHANPYAPRRYRDSFAQFNAETWIQSWKDSKTTTCKASEIYFRGVSESSQWWGWCANGKWEATDGDFNDIRTDDQWKSHMNNSALPGLSSNRKHYASSSNNESRVRSVHGKSRQREENEEDESSSSNENQIKLVIGGRRRRRNYTDSDSGDKRVATSGKNLGRTRPKQHLTHEDYEGANDASDSDSDSESESQSPGMIIGGRSRQSEASSPPKSQTVTGELLRSSPSSSEEEKILSRGSSSAPSAHGVIGGGMIGGSRSRSSKRPTPIGRNTDTKDTSPSPLPMHQSGSVQEQQKTSVKPHLTSPPIDAGDIATERRRKLDAQLQGRKRVPVRRRF